MKTNEIMKESRKNNYYESIAIKGDSSLAYIIKNKDKIINEFFIGRTWKAIDTWYYDHFGCTDHVKELDRLITMDTPCTIEKGKLKLEIESVDTDGYVYFKDGTKKETVFVSFDLVNA